MKRQDAKLKKVAKLVHSLESELKVLEGSFNTQFETTASLQEKLFAAKRARSALSRARNLCDAIGHALTDSEE